jgi:hypothetical protein
MTGFQSKRKMVSDPITGHWLPQRRLENFKIVDSGIVDGDQWYTIRLYRHECRDWIKSHKKEWQHEHLTADCFGTMFDIHEKLYTLLALKWTE